MKVCIFGAGAVGGHIAARLLAAGADETAVVARGAMLQAIRGRGLTLRSGGEEISVKVMVATDDPSTLPPQDLIVVTLKAYALPGAARAIARLIAPQGCAIFMLNGIPWWWRYGLPGAGGGTLPLLDPDGTLWNEVKPGRALGGVIYSPNDRIEPGVIQHSGRSHFFLGEPDNSSSERLKAAAAMFRRGGLEIKLTDDLRREIWRKLVQNASGNTIAALTRLTLGNLAADPELRHLMAGVMRETLAVAAALGWDLRAEIDTEKLAQRTAGDPRMRSSMLQDTLQKRPLEVDALLGQTQAFAREAGVSVPIIDVVLPLLRGLDRSQRAGDQVLPASP